MEKPESFEQTNHNVREEVFYNFLSSEIDHLKNEIKKPGWTNWAIMGSLATLVWLTFNEFDNNALRIHNVSFIILTSLFIHRLLRTIQLFVAEDITSKSEAKYLLTNESFGQNRVSLILEVLKYAFMIYLISSLPLGIEKHTITLLYITSSVCGFAFVCGLIFSYLQIPYSLSTRGNWTRNIVYCLSAILFFLIAFELVHFYVDHSNDFHISDFRFSALFIGGFYLVLLLSKIPQDSRMLSSLIEIRRKLIFHNLSITEAVRQTEIALTGLKVSNLLHNYIANFLKLCNEFNSKIDLLLKKLAIWDAITEKKENSKISDTDKEISESIKDSMKKIVGELLSLVDEDIPLAFRKIKIRSILISRIPKQADDEIASLLDLIDGAAATMNERTQKVKSRIDSISSSKSQNPSS
jgi:hypothetical protein